MVKLILLLLLTALYVYLIAPGKKPKKNCDAFIGLNYAYGGLHEGGDLAQNGLQAIMSAGKEGYSCCLDVRLSKDGVPVLVRDHTLRYTIGVRKAPEEAEAAELTLPERTDTGSHYITLEQGLKALDKSVPLMLMLHANGNTKKLVDAILPIMRSAGVNWCAVSEAAKDLNYLKKTAPEVCRGQAVISRKLNKGKVPFFTGMFRSWCFGNFLSRPHFILHSKGYISISVRVSEMLGAAPFCGPLNGGDDRAWYEYRNLSVLFEGYHPKPRFRKSKQQTAEDKKEAKK